MRALIFILILLAFFQATFLPLNLVLLILILRAYIRVDKVNLYLAFGLGLLLSLLMQDKLGIYSLIFLILVMIGHLSTKTPLSKHLLTVIPFSFLLLFLSYLLLSFVKGSIYIPITNLVVESLISLPIYIGLRIWEERFIVRPDVKLKI